MAAKVTTFDRTACRVVGDRAFAALEAVAKEFGLSVVQRSGSFAAKNYTFKAEFAVVGSDGTVLDRDAEEYKRNAKLLGLPPLGSQVSVYGTLYTVTGLRLRSRQYPVVAERVKDGKTFKLPMDTVKAGFANPEGVSR